VSKNDDCALRKEGPGLKPVVFAVFFAGLKPCAPSQKQLFFQEDHSISEGDEFEALE
jgi:hypothetical protein